MKPARPVYLNLFKIRQPLPAWVSFGHRVSGAVLFIGIPILLLALSDLLNACTPPSPVFRLALYVILSAYAFHFFAGLRFLLLDLHWGGSVRAARGASLAVVIAALVAITGLGLWLW